MKDEVEADAVVAPAHDHGVDGEGAFGGGFTLVGERHADDGAGVPALVSDDVDSGFADVPNAMGNRCAAGKEEGGETGNRLAKNTALVIGFC